MAKRSKNKNPPGPPKVRAKTGTSKKSEDVKLAVSERYLNAYHQSPVADLVKVEAATLKEKRATLVKRLGERKAAVQQVDTVNAAVITANREHDDATTDYARAVARHGNGDPTVLMASGVEQAASRKRHQPIPEKVTNVAVERGTESGTSDISYDRPDGAASFAIRYKLDPSTEADPWLPKDGPIQTRMTEWTIEGLPPNADLRVGVQAIGDYPGPWSDDKVGKTR